MFVDHERLTLPDEKVVRGAHPTFGRTQSIGFSNFRFLEVASKKGNRPGGYS